MNTLNQKISSCELVSGEESRKYRKRIAAAANAGRDDALQTIKFKLEKKDSLQLPPFDAFRSLYDTLEGVEKGTLTYLLFTLIVSGFRLFPSSKEAITYQNRSKFHSPKFLKTAQKVFAESLPKFTPERIVNRIGQSVSRKNLSDGKSPKDILFTVYKKEWARNSKNAEFDRILENITEKLSTQFPNIQDIALNREAALHTVDSILMPLGFPSLANMTKSITTKLPAHSSIVFDSAVPFTVPNADLNPYCAIAVILQTYDWSSNEAANRHIKEHLTTTSNNALSWLFNKGIKLFKERSLTESADGKPSLSELFTVPAERLDSLRCVKEAAEAIPDEKTLLKRSGIIIPYSEFRSNFGGHIDCWVTKYIHRLIELRTLLTHQPESLTIPSEFINEAGNDFLHFAGLLRSEVKSAVSTFTSLKPQATTALDKLCGVNHCLPTAADIENLRLLTASINRLASIYRTLANTLMQTEKDKHSEWKDLPERLAGGAWESWKNLTILPKLTSLSGGIPEEQKTLNQLASDFTAVQKLRSESLKRVISWAKTNGAYSSVFEAVKTKERDAVQKRSSENSDPAIFIREQAARKIFSLIAGVLRNSNDRISEAGRRWFKAQNIFRREKDFNKFFFNLQGGLYRTVFSTSRHQPFEITRESISNIQIIWNRFKDFFAEEDNKTDLFSEERRTLLRIQNLIDTLELSAITRVIPKAVADIHLPDSCKASLSEEVVLALHNSTVSPRLFIKAFSTYNSLLSGFVMQLRRERFFLRAKFLWIENNTLCYIPKNKLWSIPNTYLKDPEFAEVFYSENVIKVNNQIDTEATFIQLARNKADLTGKLRKFLAQMPHDWVYIAPFENQGAAPISCDILRICKKDSGWKKADYNRLMRLIGPSNFKTRLDRLMLEPEKYVLGDITLLVDQGVSQKMDEKATVHLDYEEPILSVALPIKEIFQNENKERTAFPFKRIIAIDQGEAGLAFAVFDLSEAGNARAIPVATGTVSIPSIRSLIRSVRKFRKFGQSTSRFNERFDSTMFNVRKNVTGDITHVIIGLMKRFQAFPVLEKQVALLESRSNHLSLVYKATNSRFLWSQTASQTDTRKNLWFNGEYWIVPGIKIRKDEYKEVVNDKGEKKKQKTSSSYWSDFRIYPGCHADAAFTSQICSQCNRNIGEMLWRAGNDSTYKKIRLDKDGCTDLFGETIQLYKANPAERQKYRSRNERNPLSEPYGEATLKFSDFRRLVKLNLRRAPKSLQSRDTTQSQFSCVFKNCDNHNKTVHADVNAAVNIGRRLLEKLMKA
jgi:hypothetical protein